MADDWVERLNAFYAAYMAYFGVEADVAEAGRLDAKDRATIAGLRAASGTLPRENTEECSRAKPSGPTAESGDAQPTPVSDPISNKGR